MWNWTAKIKEKIGDVTTRDILVFSFVMVACHLLGVAKWVGM